MRNTRDATALPLGNAAASLVKVYFTLFSARGTVNIITIIARISTKSIEAAAATALASAHRSSTSSAPPAQP